MLHMVDVRVVIGRVCEHEAKGECKIASQFLRTYISHASCPSLVETEDSSTSVVTALADLS